MNDQDLHGRFSREIERLFSALYTAEETAKSMGHRDIVREMSAFSTRLQRALNAAGIEDVE